MVSASRLALGSVLAKYRLSLEQAPGTSIGPLPFLTLQRLGGLVFLVAVRTARGWRSEPFELLLHPALAGIILGVGSVRTIAARALISAGEASVVFATHPGLTMGFAWVLLEERVPL